MANRRDFKLLEERIMTQTTPPTNQYQFAHAAPSSAMPWKRIFRIVRWTTYALGVVTLVLLLHKAPPPPWRRVHRRLRAPRKNLSRRKRPSPAGGPRRCAWMKRS